MRYPASTRKPAACAPESRKTFQTAGVQMVKPVQYMDRWRLDTRGVHAVNNDSAKRALGFPPGT